MNFSGLHWHKEKIKFTQSTLLQVIQTLSCKQSEITTTERKSKDKNLPKTTPKMAWARTPQKCWGLSIRITHAFSPSEIKSLHNNFSITFFLPPQSASNPSNGFWIIFLVLCLPSMHINPQHSTTSHKFWSHRFFQQKQNREGEEKKKRENTGEKSKENKVTPTKQPPEPNPFPFFIFLRQQKWANKTQRIKAEITKRKKRERLEGEGRMSKNRTLTTQNKRKIKTNQLNWELRVS